MALRLYNTLAHQVEEFTPLQPPRVTMYVCGPTVYDDPHLGHLRSVYAFDVLHRYLEHKGYEVTFVRNVTDVDDKIIERAQTSGQPPEQIASRYLSAYQEALRKFGIRKPTVEPKATEHIDQMLELISKLIWKGYAYQVGNNVYFSVQKAKSYGNLSHQQLNAMQVGTRGEPEVGKQFPLDFALWKAAKPGEPSWSSPWGEGRPGWHIECSAMSMHCLETEQLDIHGGGIDLIFPHHENEIAQSEGATGKTPFAKYWVHHGLVTVQDQKMSKSLGNFVTVDNVLSRYNADVLKLFFLKTHYRSPIDYTQEYMEESKKNFDEFSRFFTLYRQVEIQGFLMAAEARQWQMEVEKRKQAFEKAMDDDLNTPQALAVIFDLVNFGVSRIEPDHPMQLYVVKLAYEVIRECSEVLGLTIAMSSGSSNIDTRIQTLIAERNHARQSKDFKRADEIRQQLVQEGILLTDTASGTLWHRKQ